MSSPASRLLAVLAALALTVSMVPAAPAATSGTLDEGAATDWVLDAHWTDEGLFTEFPEQVVFPQESRLSLETLEEHEAAGNVDASLVARGAQDMQLDSGGFLRAAGDFLGPWTGATTHGLLLAHEYGDRSEVDESAAGDFLVGMQNDDGGFGPRLGFYGISPIRSSMSATHAALVGLDHLGDLNETIAQDAVHYLENERQDDGGWPSHAHSSTSSVEGTYYALRSLALLGELDPVTADEAESFLYNLERKSGGFFGDANQNPCSGSFCQIDPEVTTTSTSQAILGLATVDGLDQLNQTTRQQHLDWLADRQEDAGRFEGGFESYETSDAPVVDYRTNTRLALEAVGTLEGGGAIDRPAALTFLSDTHHEGSGGFAMWPGSLSGAIDTGAATRALSMLGELDQMSDEELADTFARTQRDDGSIHGPDWDGGASTQRTAGAVNALVRTGNLDAIDAEAAGDFLLDRQTDQGGFTENAGLTGNGNPEIRTTYDAVTALANLDRLGEANASAIANYLADHQDEDEGYISEKSGGYPAVWHTSLALQTLATINETGVVDEDAAGAFLADHQRADGSYAGAGIAAHITLGLAAIDQLDRIDDGRTETFLESEQTDRGGLAERAFYASENAMARHASALTALNVLDATADGGSCSDRAPDRPGTPSSECPSR